MLRYSAWSPAVAAFATAAAWQAILRPIIPIAL